MPLCNLRSISLRGPTALLKQLLKRIDELVATRTTFSFETTLAARSYHASVIQWRRLGYRVIRYFIWFPSPGLAIQRVAKRVREGGHNIPEAVVRRRYARGLANLLGLYIPIVNTICGYDGASFPSIPIAEIEGERELVLDYNIWERIQLHRKDASNDWKQRSRLVDRQDRYGIRGSLPKSHRSSSPIEDRNRHLA